MEPIVSGTGINPRPTLGLAGWLAGWSAPCRALRRAVRTALLPAAPWRPPMTLISAAASVTLAGSCYWEPAEGPVVVLSQAEIARIVRVETGLTPWRRLPGFPAPRASITERMEHYQVPGAVVALLQEGRISWVRGYGAAGSGGRPPVLPDTWFPAEWLAPELLRLREGVGGGVLDQRNPLPPHLLPEAARRHDAKGFPLPLDPSGPWVSAKGVGRLLHRVWEAAPHLLLDTLVLSQEGEPAHLFFLSETGEGAVIFTNGAGGGALGLEILEVLAREYGWEGAPSPPVMERLETGIATEADGYRGSWDVAEIPGSRFHLEQVGQALRMTLEGPRAPEQEPAPATHYFPLTEGSWLEPRSGNRIQLEAGGETLRLEPWGYLANRVNSASVTPPPPPDDPPLPGVS